MYHFVNVGIMLVHLSMDFRCKIVDANKKNKIYL